MGSSIPTVDQAVNNGFVSAERQGQLNAFAAILVTMLDLSNRRSGIYVPRRSNNPVFLWGVDKSAGTHGRAPFHHPIQWLIFMKSGMNLTPLDWWRERFPKTRPIHFLIPVAFYFWKKKVSAMLTGGKNNYKRCCIKCKNYEIGAYFEPFAWTTAKTLSCRVSNRVPTQAHVPCGTVCKKKIF